MSLPPDKPDSIVPPGGAPKISVGTGAESKPEPKPVLRTDAAAVDATTRITADTKLAAERKRAADDAATTRLTAAGAPKPRPFDRTDKKQKAKGESEEEKKKAEPKPDIRYEGKPQENTIWHIFWRAIANALQATVGGAIMAVGVALKTPGALITKPLKWTGKVLEKLGATTLGKALQFPDKINKIPGDWVMGKGFDMFKDAGRDMVGYTQIRTAPKEPEAETPTEEIKKPKKASLENLSKPNPELMDRLARSKDGMEQMSKSAIEMPISKSGTKPELEGEASHAMLTQSKDDASKKPSLTALAPKPIPTPEVEGPSASTSQSHRLSPGRGG